MVPVLINTRDSRDEADAALYEGAETGLGDDK